MHSPGACVLKREKLGAYQKFQAFPTDTEPSRLSPVPLRSRMQIYTCKCVYTCGFFFMYTHGHMHSCSEAASLLVHPKLLPKGWCYLSVTEVEGSGLIWEHCHIQRVRFNGFVQSMSHPGYFSPSGVECSSPPRRVVSRCELTFGEWNNCALEQLIKCFLSSYWVYCYKPFTE